MNKPTIPCDVCGSTDNVQWWQSTAGTCCNKSECHTEQARRFTQGIADQEAAEQYARDMGWQP